MDFEKPLDQFRQVKCEIKKRIRHEFGISNEVIGYSYRLQRSWKVQVGPAYVPALNGPPDRKEDYFVHAIAEGPIWLPCKHEWRYLPEVTEEEAQKDST